MTKMAQTRLFDAIPDTLATGTFAEWHLLDSPSSPVAAPRPAPLSNVYRALARVFETDVSERLPHMVLHLPGPHETGLAAQPVPAAEQGRGLAFIRGLGALERALGVAHARQVLRQTHWIIALVDGQNTSPAEAAACLENLRQLERLLIIWCQPPSGTSSAPLTTSGRKELPLAIDPLKIHWVDSPGLQRLGPVPADDLDSLVVALDQIKNSQQAAVVEVTLAPAKAVEASSTTRFDPSAPARVTPAARQRSASLPVVWELLAQAAAVHSDLVIVNMLGAAASAPTPQQPSGKYFERAAGDRNALIWCSGVAAGGCRPCILMDQEQFDELSPDCIEEMCGQGRSLTFLVRPSPAALLPSGVKKPGGASALAGLPNALVMYPASIDELEQMLECSWRHRGAALVWLPAVGLGAGPSGEPVRPARSQFLREGKDLVLLALGGATDAACGAADQLQEQGIAASVVNARFLQPLDEALIERVRRAQALVIVGEDAATFAADGLVRGLLAERGCAVPIAAVNLSGSRRRQQRRSRQEPFIQTIVEESRLLVGGFPRRLDAPILPSAIPAETDNSAWPVELRCGCENLDEELAAVVAAPLSGEMQAWIAAYAKVGRRNLYLWQWCQRGIELTTLSSVRPDLREHVTDTKLLGVMLDVLLDDVADTLRDHVLLERLIAGLDGGGGFDDCTETERQYAEFTLRVWQSIRGRLRHYPQWEAFEELFLYDYAQLFNTMRYASLVNRRLELMNLSEHEVYLPHNMHMMIFGTLDMMCSPTLEPHELGKLREVMWHAQCMGQIGNQITTWQRELNEGDFSSGVFARALSYGDLTVAQLEAGDRRQIAAAIREGKHEEHFVSRWREHRKRLSAMVRQVRSFDVAALLKGLDRLMQIEMGSRGQR